MPRQKLSKPVSIPETPVFTTFDDKEDFWIVPGYERNLPHWRLVGATYFVTFRLADSIPQKVAERWKQEQSQWLFSHNIDLHWRKSDPERFRQAIGGLDPAVRTAFEHEMTRQFFVELDQCHGCGALRMAAAQRQVAESLLHFHGQRLWVGDFVVMPNHVHAIVQPFEGVLLEEWLYSVKRFTAAHLMQDADVRPHLVTRVEHVWQPESFDRVIRDLAEMRKTREYIANNPRRLREGDYHLYRAAWLDAWL